jgi:Uri superfamily endonuclease
MKGTYLLLMELKRDERINVGKIGTLEFRKGFYVYIGSALNDLNSRIRRHLSNVKKIRWHIDYFLKKAVIKDVFYKESKNREECTISKAFKNLQPIPKFGSSDCDCNTHLFYGSKGEIIKIIKRLDLRKF